MIQNPQGAVHWWRALMPDPGRADRTERGGDRAAAAGLRHCATIADAMLRPATIALFRQCRAQDARDLERVALAAAVLAHVRTDRPGPPVARQLGPETPDKPETALLKPLRFRRLLEASEPDECLTAFRRLVALADGELNVNDLVRALFDWPDRYRADRIKRRWVFDYWNADPGGTATKAEGTAT